MRFTDYHDNTDSHIDYLAHGTEADGIWTTFIFDKSYGFTKNKNYSIITYCWSILGSQSQTMTDIILTSTMSDEQNNFRKH